MNRNRTVNRKKFSVRLTEPKIFKNSTRLIGFLVFRFDFSVSVFFSPLLEGGDEVIYCLLDEIDNIDDENFNNLNIRIAARSLEVFK